MEKFTHLETGTPGKRGSGKVFTDEPKPTGKKGRLKREPVTTASVGKRKSGVFDRMTEGIKRRPRALASIDTGGGSNMPQNESDYEGGRYYRKGGSVRDPRTKYAK